MAQGKYPSRMAPSRFSTPMVERKAFFQMELLSRYHSKMNVCLSCLLVCFLHFSASFLFTLLHTASTDMVKRWWSLLMGRERSTLHCTRGGCSRMEPLKPSIGMGDKRQSSHLGGFTLRTMNVSL